MLHQGLNDYPNGTTLIVKSVADNLLGTKLTEMGIVEGKKMRVLYRAPFGCPLAIDMGDHVLSLRKAEARLIMVASI